MKIITPQNKPLITRRHDDEKYACLHSPQLSVQNYVKAVELRKTAACGPRDPDYKCKASWEVRQGKDAQLRFLVFAEGKIIRTLFHGTGVDPASSIIKNGFDISKFSAHGFLGSGIYLGLLRKALGFANPYRGQRNRNNEFDRRVRYVLQVSAALGDVFNPNFSRRDIKKQALAAGCYVAAAGCGPNPAAWAGKLLHDEWCVYNEEAVLVTHLHEYHKRTRPAHTFVEYKRCDAAKIRSTVVDPAMAKLLGDDAFVRCSGIATTPVRTTLGQVVLCPECAHKNAMHIGSTIELFVGKKKKKKTTARITAKQ